MTITKVELAWKGIFMLSCVVYDLKNARPPSSFSMDFAQADQRRCLEQHICIRCFTAEIDTAVLLFVTSESAVLIFVT